MAGRPSLLYCGAFCGGGVREGRTLLAGLLCSSPTFQQIFLWGWEFLPPLQPPQYFIARDFESLVSLSANPSSPMWSATLPWVLSTPPAGLDECFFNSLVVRVPCSLIFWHFWLFIVFKLVVIILLVVQGNEAFLPEASQLPFLKKWKRIYSNSHGSARGLR